MHQKFHTYLTNKITYLLFTIYYLLLLFTIYYLLFIHCIIELFSDSAQLDDEKVNADAKADTECEPLESNYHIFGTNQTFKVDFH